MQLISVNIGQERPIQIGSRTDKTGIYKQPVEGPVQVAALGLDGDTVIDSSHGGVDQAVYVYGAGDYAWWNAALGQELQAGTFGENLTISELESAGIRIGDRLRVGAVLLEVTAARIPCATLAARMGDPGFVKRYREAGRPGLYCRVIETGAVCAGDSVTLERYAGETVNIQEMFETFYDHTSEAAVRRVLAAPIAVRARQDFEGWLAAMQA